MGARSPVRCASPFLSQQHHLEVLPAEPPLTVSAGLSSCVPSMGVTRR